MPIDLSSLKATVFEDLERELGVTRKVLSCASRGAAELEAARKVHVAGEAALTRGDVAGVVPCDAGGG